VLPVLRWVTMVAPTSFHGFSHSWKIGAAARFSCA
jgi:hypothetical protein